jgi:hypothetical protein
MTCAARWTLAIVVLAALWPAGRACAQNNAPSPFTPVETPTYDTAPAKTPKTTVPDTGTAAKLKQTNQSGSGIKLPNKVELGKYQLQFNAGRTSDVSPHTGYDSGETSNLSKVAPGQKEESAAPDYFGLKLSTPTR